MELFEQWSEAKGVLMEGLSEKQKKYVAPLLENQKQYITETAAAGVSAAGAIANFQKIAIPMIRRIIPGTIATELVGVQPLAGPVGLAYSLRFLFSENMDVAPQGAGSEDIVGGSTEVFGNNSKTKRFYSGAVDANGVATGATAVTSDFEAFGGRQLSLEVLKQTVTAGTRKLQAKWTLEAAQDLTAQHGLNLEAEITAALSAEIVSEIDNEIINDLIALAGTVETFDMAGSFTGTPHFVGDRHAVLGVLINKVANEIAR